jgi:hypothetical protein
MRQPHRGGIVTEEQEADEAGKAAEATSKNAWKLNTVVAHEAAAASAADAANKAAGAGYVEMLTTMQYMANQHVGAARALGGPFISVELPDDRYL